jgi:hypothetical protein
MPDDEFIEDTTGRHQAYHRELKEKMQEIRDCQRPVKRPVSQEIKKREPLDMLTVLRRHSQLTEDEFDEKVRTLHSINL